LALVLAARTRREVGEAEPESRIIGADVERQRIGRRRRSLAPGRNVQQKSRRLPRRDAAGQLLAKTGRVGSGAECFAGQDRRGGVLTVIGRILVKAANDDVGLERADHPDDVSERLLVIPDGQRLGGGLRVPEVAHAREALLGAVERAGRQQFFGADDVEQLALLGADQVLPATAAGQREVGGGDVTIVGKIGEQAGVLVIGVGRDVQDAARTGEAVERVGEHACIHGRLLGRRRRTQGGDGE
jgi:hypothetical protein